MSFTVPNQRSFPTPMCCHIWHEMLPSVLVDVLIFIMIIVVQQINDKSASVVSISKHY